MTVYFMWRVQKHYYLLLYFHNKRFKTNYEAIEKSTRRYIIYSIKLGVLCVQYISMTENVPI